MNTWGWNNSFHNSEMIYLRVYCSDLQIYLQQRGVKYVVYDWTTSLIRFEISKRALKLLKEYKGRQSILQGTVRSGLSRHASFYLISAARDNILYCLYLESDKGNITNEFRSKMFRWDKELNYQGNLEDCWLLKPVLEKLPPGLAREIVEYLIWAY